MSFLSENDALIVQVNKPALPMNNNVFGVRFSRAVGTVKIVVCGVLLHNVITVYIPKLTHTLKTYLKKN